MATIAETVEVALQHHRAGNLSQAGELYNQILCKNPFDPVALHSLGLIAYQSGKYDLAVEYISKAIDKNPKIPELFNILGLALEAQGEPEKAIEAYRRAVSLRPDFAGACHNIAIAMQSLGDYHAAEQNAEQAINIKPDYALAYNTLGYVLQMQEKYTGAIENYRKAIQLKPDFAEAYNHLGVVLVTQGKYEQAAENYKQAIAIDPDYAEAHWNQALVLLLKGQLEEGFREYQWRKKVEFDVSNYPHCFDKPTWNGEPFKDKTLLVHYEQGIGDTIQFIRYLPLVKARGGKVILEARKPLGDLLRGLPGIDELIEAAFDKKPDVNFDFHISLMDLPAIFETTLETIPADIPYLHADPEKVEHWKNRINTDDFNVGIVWAGAAIHEKDHIRSCKLREFETLAQIPGVKLYSLQKGPQTKQISRVSDEIRITDMANYLDDFSDTAAVIENLDLVISVDTAVVHLAGAMGKPVWLLLPSAPDWRWMLNRQDSPWYPTMRLFRQETQGQWSPVFERVTAELTALAAKNSSKIGSPVDNQKAVKEKVPVIIPAYKNPRQLENCINHLKNQTVPVEMFVKDNNQDNIYFTAAINEGIRKHLNCDGGYIIILNQDMYLEPDAAEEMVKFMDSHPKCGIGAPLQLHPQNRDYVICAGSYEAFPFGRHQGGKLSDFKNDEEIFWANGACTILRKRMIEEIGLFDENFVLLGSDSDYCFTARSRGWQVWRIAAAKGVHEHGASGELLGDEFEKLKLDDMIYFGKKWLTGQVYRDLACEGKDCTPQMIGSTMARLIAAREELAPTPKK